MLQLYTNNIKNKKLTKYTNIHHNKRPFFAKLQIASGRVGTLSPHVTSSSFARLSLVTHGQNNLPRLTVAHQLHPTDILYFFKVLSTIWSLGHRAEREVKFAVLRKII